MNNKLSFLSKNVELSEQKSNENLTAKFCLCDFSVNGNGVRLNRDSIDNWVSTLVNQPLVGRIGYTGDFTGHNMRVGKYADAEGNICEDVMFDTEAIGTFTSVGIETQDNVDYIVGSAEIWSRYPTVCELIKKRVADGELHTSWEIIVSESHDDAGVKVIDNGRFTALCVLGKNVTPAFASSKLLEVAEDASDTELTEALTHDISACEGDKYMTEEKIVVSEDAQEVVESAEEVSEVVEGANEALAEQDNTDVSEEKPEEDEEDVEESECKKDKEDSECKKDEEDSECKKDKENSECKDEEEEEKETSESEEEEKEDEEGTCGKDREKSEAEEIAELTMRDLRYRIDDAICRTGRLSCVEFVFPEEHIAWARDYECCPSELDYLQYEYSVNGEDVSVGEPTPIRLSASPRQINNIISEKNEAIANAATRISELENEVATLKPYKEAADKVAAEKAEIEKAEKISALKDYAIKSGLISSEEINGESAISNMIAELNESGIKQIIAERFMDGIGNKNHVEVSTKNEEVGAMNLYDGDADADVNIISAYLNKK